MQIMLLASHCKILYSKFNNNKKKILTIKNFVCKNIWREKYFLRDHFFFENKIFRENLFNF